MLMVKNNREIEIDGINWETQRVILATVHRRENWGENLVNIAEGFKSIADNNLDTSLIIPLHRNAIVREPLKKNIRRSSSNKINRAFKLCRSD